MKSLTDYLERYRRMTPPDMVIRDSVVDLFNKYFSYPITREQVKVRAKVVYVDCPSLVKSELSLNKKELLSELSLLASPYIVRDIR